VVDPADQRRWVQAACEIARDALTSWKRWDDERPRRAVETAERWLDGLATSAACSKSARDADDCANGLFKQAHATAKSPYTSGLWNTLAHVAKSCAAAAAAATVGTADEAAAWTHHAANAAEGFWPDEQARAQSRQRSAAAIERATR
jgi:hypothetical protein